MDDPTATSARVPKRFGEILVDGGAMDAEALERLLELQQRAPGHSRLGDLAVEYGFCSSEDLVGALSTQLGLAAADLDTIDSALVDQLGVEFCGKFRVVPLRRDGDVVVVAMVDPTDEQAKRKLEAALELPTERLRYEVVALRPLLGVLRGGAKTSAGDPEGVDLTSQTSEQLVELRDAIVAELDRRLLG